MYFYSEWLRFILSTNLTSSSPSVSVYPLFFQKIPKTLNFNLILSGLLLLKFQIENESTITNTASCSLCSLNFIHGRNNASFVATAVSFFLAAAMIRDAKRFEKEEK